MTDEMAIADRIDDEFPRFEPHPLVRGGHMQTLVGYGLAGRGTGPEGHRRVVELGQGDRLVAVEDASPGLGGDAPIALLLHGLAGDADSAYQRRVARRLVRSGMRAVRLNLRNAGGGFGMARGTYHAGRTGDVRAAVEWLARRHPGAPMALVGFSLGGNLALKLAAEAAERPLPNLDCVLAASPPIDLEACCRRLQRRPGAFYGGFFVRQLRRDIGRLHAEVPEMGPVDLAGVRSLIEFDAHYTAPRNGFDDVADYYRRSSAGPMVGAIRVDGLVVHASDDPFIPAEVVISGKFPSRVRLEVAQGGGHLGFVSRRRLGGDRRWLDARLAHWLAGRFGLDLDEAAEAEGPVVPLPRSSPTTPRDESCSEPTTASGASARPSTS